MSFDRLAPHYRWMEILSAGEKLQRCRAAFLAEVGPATKVLIVGEGNGRFLCELLRCNASARVTCVDASARMLELARDRAERHGLPLDRVRFVHADVLAWQPDGGPFDLVVTHFFLDCFRPDQLEQITARLAECASPTAAWLLADFCEPARGWSRLRARIILATMYAFFRWVTTLPARRLTPPDAFLARAGFKLAARQVTEWGLLHSDLWVRGDRGLTTA